MMNARTQRIKKDGHVSWLVLDSSRRIVQPVKQYLTYLRNIESSPNTIRSYAGHLAKFWQYLEKHGLNWRCVGLKELSSYMTWLRYPDHSELHKASNEPLRARSTVNTMLTVVYNFYEFQRRSGSIAGFDGFKYEHTKRGNYKPFLHHLSKGKPVKTKLVRLKEPKKRPKTLDKADVEAITKACDCKRDQFLVTLIAETGMRIGQALGLRHSDIDSRNKRVLIIPRNDNVNGARAKTRVEYSIVVSSQLLELYSDYLVEEYPRADSDYVFVNVRSGQIGEPMTYDGSVRLLKTLRRKTGLYFSWHMFRHTHATELIRDGMNMVLVQKRLGHQSIQTTIDTYTHISDQDLQTEYQRFIEK